MTKFVIAVFLACSVSCAADPLCGASEEAGRINVRHFVEEESFEKRCEASGSIDLFKVDELPNQANLETELVSAPFETLNVGDHDIAPGTYIQCASLENGEVGGLCSGFTLQANEGVAVVIHIRAPDGIECYSTKDIVKYTNVGPVSR